jgi:hypothetical protein
MILSLCMQIAIVVWLIVASRKRLEDALPALAFFLVVMPLESQIRLPGLFDLTTMRITLLTVVVLYLMRSEPRNVDPLPLRGLIVLHVAWAALSTLYSVSVLTSAKQLMAQVMEFYLLYFLLVRTITSVQTIYRILYSVMMGISLCCIFAIIESATHWSILRIFPPSMWITYNGGVDPIFIEIGRGLRVRSTFPHPILFGGALSMSIPLTLYLLSVWELSWKRAVIWPALALMVWSLYKTSSRGPWLSTGVGCALLLLLIRGGVRRNLIVFSLVAALAATARPGVWSSVSGLYTATTDSSSPTGTSYMYREALYHAVREAVAKEPGRALMGYGLGTFREKGLEIAFLGRTRRWFTCDSNWAAFLYETGYVGLGIIGALLFGALRIAWLGFRALPEPENALSGVFLICLLAFDFLLVSVAAYSWGQQGYLAWILISLAVSHWQLVSGEGAGGLDEEPDPIIQGEEHVLIST